MLVDNKLNDDATYDFEKLEKAIKSMQDVGQLIGTGYTEEALDEVLKDLPTELEKPSKNSSKEPTDAKLDAVIDVVLLLTDEKFYLYKKTIGIIADYHKVNPTKAGMIAVESYANKLIGN